MRVDPRRWLPLVVGLGLAVRVALIFSAQARPQTFEYDALARSLLAGEGYVYWHLGVPYRNYYAGIVYVWLTAAVYAVLSDASLRGMLLSQAVLAAAGAVAVFFLARRLWDGRRALVAALLATLHPALVYYDTQKLHPLGFDSLLTTCAVAAPLWALGSRSLYPAPLAGLVLGVGALQRGSLLAFVPLAGLWLWLEGGRSRRSLLAVAGLLSGALLVVAPWLGRSQMLHGVPLVLTTTGEHFWIGNAEQSHGSALLPSGRPVIDTLAPALREQLAGADEVEQNGIFWQAGWALAREQPARLLSKFLRKLTYFWSVAPQTGVLYPAGYLHAYLLYYALVLALAALGGIRQWRRRDSASGGRAGLRLILLLFLCVSAVHAIFYVESRHRWALEPLLLVLAAGALPSRSSTASSTR